jgi:signal transduction histidine kinase
VQLWSDGDAIRLYVQDNGRGTEKVIKGIGLLGMEERVAPYGGIVDVSIPQEGGFKLTLILPLRLKGTDYGGEDKNTPGG